MSSYRIVFFAAVCFLTLVSKVFAHHPGYVPAGSVDREGNLSSGAMVNAPTASTLGKHHVTLSFAFDYALYNSIPAGNAHRLHHRGRDVHGKNHEEFYNLSVGYGVLRDLDIHLAAPIVSKNSIEVHDHDHLGNKEPAAGFGDMRLLSKYRFWKKQIEAALLAGIQFPTGRTTAKRKSSDKFAAENQPGTGSWDAEFGIALSRNFMQRVSAATSFQYFLKTEGAQEHEAGDVFRYNLGTGYALRDMGKHPNLSVTFEMNHEWALRDHTRTARRVLDSGGTTVFLTPGLNAQLSKHFSVFWGMPIPVYQDLGGEHEELKFETLTGMNLYF